MALQAQLIAEREGARHERRPEQHDAHIALGQRLHGGRGAREPHQRRQPQQSRNGQHRPARHAELQPGGSHARGLCPAPRPESLRHIVARTVTEEEAHGLDDRHDGKSHPDGGHGLRAEAAHEVGVGHIVETRDEHRHHGGHGQHEHDAPHGRLGQKGIVVVVRVCHAGMS